MSKFEQMVDAPAGSKFVLQGNQAFALGVMHAGYHSADGYPGTPSTEIIDKSLAKVQDRINVGWSVNEAVSVAVGVGRAIAGDDTLVTMKTPGALQAGDTITTAAFYHAPAGALVLLVASDYAPSSTQHVIDLKYLFASSRIPVLEPRNHQEMYELPRHAADISRKFNTPVVILANGILCHSEALIETGESRKVGRRDVSKDLKNWMGMPYLARLGYNKATTERIPQLSQWLESSTLVTETEGTEDWSIIAGGESNIIVAEALKTLGCKPAILSLAALYPIPETRITEFCAKSKGKVLVFEDGDKFLEEKIRLLGMDVVSKGKFSTITEWTPESVIDHIIKHVESVNFVQPESRKLELPPVIRPPSICPGCPYRALGLTVDKLRKQGKIFSSFGDIGCSTLLYFLNAIDTCLCMGASDAMRQGFVLSRPEYASKTLSVVGDSCECHSGLDATRNSVFRNVPGVKIVLDNCITAMTGGQPAPSSSSNLAGIPNKFSLRKALEAEQARVVVVDSYDIAAVEKALVEALERAKTGEFSVLLLEGACINEVASKQKVPDLTVNGDLCKQCGKCNMCPGIELDEERNPHFTSLCSNCAGGMQVCMQLCSFGAIEGISESGALHAADLQGVLQHRQESKKVKMDRCSLPESLRLAIRGIGGQGNLFFGKILADMMLNTPYAETHIVKGDTHGMAQLGGPVISTFSCGDVHSPVLAPGSADVLVVMEMSEVLRPGFLELLKPGGTIIFNTFRALPPNIKKENYPQLADVNRTLDGYKVITIDANKVAYDLNDKTGKTANVVVLGLLSTVAPFNQVPEEIWLNSLMSHSPNDNVKSANYIAFKGGASHDQ
ncbi:MAG: 2-oxoacid:acceptor oxidoreductase family protein [Desulfuromonadales bacterium]|nr:2-oxoacid:acceptor oxidoreductase family protein [Desulfuromonadales bacterium]